MGVLIALTISSTSPPHASATTAGNLRRPVFAAAAGWACRQLRLLPFASTGFANAGWAGGMVVTGRYFDSALSTRYPGDLRMPLRALPGPAFCICVSLTRALAETPGVITLTTPALHISTRRRDTTSSLPSRTSPRQRHTRPAIQRAQQPLRWLIAPGDNIHLHSMAFCSQTAIFNTGIPSWRLVRGQPGRDKLFI